MMITKKLRTFQQRAAIDILFSKRGTKILTLAAIMPTRYDIRTVCHLSIAYSGLDRLAMPRTKFAVMKLLVAPCPLLGTQAHGQLGGLTIATMPVIINQPVTQDKPLAILGGARIATQEY